MEAGGILSIDKPNRKRLIRHLDTAETPGFVTSKRG